jgi:hypothetical protein
VDFGIDVCDRTVEVASFIISVEAGVNIDVPVVTSVVSDTVDKNVDRLFVLSTIVLGPTDDIAKLDEIMFEV